MDDFLLFLTTHFAFASVLLQHSNTSDWLLFSYGKFKQIKHLFKCIKTYSVGTVALQGIYLSYHTRDDDKIKYDLIKPFPWTSEVPVTVHLTAVV